MPVKWTPEIDQILLLKILETSEVSPKCVEIAEKWPTGLYRPTPRAISERIFKIRAAAKASGATGHFSISKANPGTPRKNAANGTAKNATPRKTGGGKRRRGGRLSDDEANDDSEPEDFKADEVFDISDDETPKKKLKADIAATGKSVDNDPSVVKFEEEEEENGALSDNNTYENNFVADDGGTQIVDYA